MQLRMRALKRLPVVLDDVGDCIPKRLHIHHALLIKLERVGVPVMVGEVCQRVIQAVAAS